MTLGKPAQADFVQVRQRRNDPERFARRNVEVVGRLVADHDVDLHPAGQRAVDLADDRQRQVEVRCANGQLLLGAGDQFADHPVQRIVLADAKQRADGQTGPVGGALRGVVRRVLEAAAQVTDVIAQAAGGRQVWQVEAVHRFGSHQAVLHQVLHRIGQFTIVQQVIAVVAVLVELVQIHVVQARTAVDHAVIDHEAFKVQHTEQFAGLYRNAVDRHFAGMGAGHFLIPGGVARLLAGTDQAALGAQPVDDHHHVQFRTRQFGRVQGIENFLAGFILLQVQRNDVDAPGRAGDFLQQATTEFGSAAEDANGIGRQRKTAQLGQQGAFEKRRHRARNGSNPKNP
ncbi:hypothetical protein D3C73_652610 [compost metagenome]